MEVLVVKFVTARETGLTERQVGSTGSDPTPEICPACRRERGLLSTSDYEWSSASKRTASVGYAKKVWYKRRACPSGS